ncbi:MAG: hypothetical protein ACODAQ_11900 [Phycisphaeraceae bacterium]
MGICEQCGNDYDKTFTLTLHDGSEHTFDSIECAAERIAPRCENCGVRILGHGLEGEGHYFCCHSCAEKVGYPTLKDRV